MLRSESADYRKRNRAARTEQIRTTLLSALRSSLLCCEAKVPINENITAHLGESKSAPRCSSLNWRLTVRAGVCLHFHHFCFFRSEQFLDVLDMLVRHLLYFLLASDAFVFGSVKIFFGFFKAFVGIAANIA